MLPQILTADFSHFGYWDLAQARKLLNAYQEQPNAPTLGFGLTVNFNTHSGCFFLSDEDFRVVIFDDEGNLREWYSCPQCGAEGFDGDTHDLNGKEAALRFEQYAGYCGKLCSQKTGG